MVDRSRERERESAFVRERLRERERTGLGAAFLIDGSRDFYLAHRPDQKLTGLFLSLSLSLFFPRLPPVRLPFPSCPWRSAISRLSKAARGACKREEEEEEKEKKKRKKKEKRRVAREAAAIGAAAA